MKTLIEIKAFLFVLLLIASSTSSAFLTPGAPGGGTQPPRYQDPQPYPGSPYPGNPYPGGDPYPQPNPPYQPPPQLDPVYPPYQPPVPNYPPTPNYPPSYGSCSRDLCVGARVYNIQRDSREAEVIGIEAAGTFVLRFIDNGGVGGNWNRDDLAVQRGCAADLCTGQQIYNVERDSRLAVVVGIQTNGKFVLRFNDNGGIGGNWNREALALPRGCGNNFCVGQYALNSQRNYRQVQIMAVDVNRRYVLKFLDNGSVGANWSDTDLVRQ